MATTPVRRVGCRIWDLGLDVRSRAYSHRGGDRRRVRARVEEKEGRFIIRATSESAGQERAREREGSRTRQGGRGEEESSVIIRATSEKGVKKEASRERRYGA
jgi:hypothetical protein